MKPLPLILCVAVMSVSSVRAASDYEDITKIAVEALKAGKKIWDKYNSEHPRVFPVKEAANGKECDVYYVPMIHHGESRGSVNWAKDACHGRRVRVRIELLNIPDENARAMVFVQGKGDKKGLTDQNREGVLHLKNAIELDWGPGHEDDRAFYFAERNGFNAEQILKQYPAAGFKITVLR